MLGAGEEIPYIETQTQGGLLVVGDARARRGIVQGLVAGNGRAETIGVGEDVVQVVEPDPRLLLLWVEQPEVALLPIEVQPTDWLPVVVVKQDPHVGAGVTMHDPLWFHGVTQNGFDDVVAQQLVHRRFDLRFFISSDASAASGAAFSCWSADRSRPVTRSFRNSWNANLTIPLKRSRIAALNCSPGATRAKKNRVNSSSGSLSCAASTSLSVSQTTGYATVRLPTCFDDLGVAKPCCSIDLIGDASMRR